MPIPCRTCDIRMGNDPAAGTSDVPSPAVRAPDEWPHPQAAPARERSWSPRIHVPDRLGQREYVDAATGLALPTRPSIRALRREMCQDAPHPSGRILSVLRV